MPDSPQPVPRHSTSPKTPASSPPLTADVKASPSSKAASPTASPSLPNSWHNAQVNFSNKTLSKRNKMHEKKVLAKCCKNNLYKSGLIDWFEIR